MRFEDVQKVRQLISSSSILSPIERAEWLQLLPNMNDKQISELMSILSGKSPMSVPVMPNLKLKEIPAHSQNIPDSNISPEDLQKRVQNIADRFAKPVTQAKPVITEVPSHIEIPKETFKEVRYVDQDLVDAYKSNQDTTVEERPKLELGSLITENDYSSLTAQMLHDSRDPEGFFRQVSTSILAVTPRTLMFAMLRAFERSPLYRVYVNSGIQLLNDDSSDRDQAYENMIRVAKERGEEYLTRKEFETMADFRFEIDKLLI